MNFTVDFIKSARFEFERYKTLGDKTFAQLSERDLHWKSSEHENSIAIIVKHLAGNMLSRWTHFLTEDGEKPWRHRDAEFENPPKTKEELILLWEKGWNCLFDALNTLNESNFETKIKIRGEKHSIVQAVHRQLAHYSGHVGQIILLGKMVKKEDWQSLSVPKGKSEAFNKKIFGKRS
ncbi:DUF1572 domain-containing protein [Allomuricauda sp. d1]|uniref:DUF1572 domain-containing protein n=1 Tax=Allomuricauda sp. d1 TaxID=3136725 RepID=UPI0031D1CDD4